MQLAFGKANLNGFQIEGTKIRIPHGNATPTWPPWRPPTPYPRISTA